MREVVRPRGNPKNENPGAFPDFCFPAEGVGFEPTVAQIDHNGFRDRPDNPLWHPSSHKVDYTKKGRERRSLCGAWTQIRCFRFRISPPVQGTPRRGNLPRANARAGDQRRAAPHEQEISV